MTAFLWVGLGCLVVYEAWSAISHRASTISQLVWKASLRYPLVPFLLGLLCGHLVW
jgi:hypothetical protein